MKKLLLTAACIAAPTAGFAEGMIQIDVGGLTYGNVMTDYSDVPLVSDVKSTVGRYGTTGTVIKVGAIDEKMFFRFELDIPGGGTRSDKFLRAGYGVLPNSLYVTFGLGSKNAYLTTDATGSDVTTFVTKKTDLALGVRWLKYMTNTTLDTEFNINYGVNELGSAAAVGVTNTPFTNVAFELKADYYYNVTDRALIGTGVSLSYDMQTWDLANVDTDVTASAFGWEVELLKGRINL